MWIEWRKGEAAKAWASALVRVRWRRSKRPGVSGEGPEDRKAKRESDIGESDIKGAFRRGRYAKAKEKRRGLRRSDAAW